MAKSQHRTGARSFNTLWNDWWSDADRRDRVENTDHWKTGILKKSLELAGRIEGQYDHRCLYPPKRASWRVQRPWPVIAGQPADYQ